MATEHPFAAQVRYQVGQLQAEVERCRKAITDDAAWMAARSAALVAAERHLAEAEDALRVLGGAPE